MLEEIGPISLLWPWPDCPANRTEHGLRLHCAHLRADLPGAMICCWCGVQLQFPPPRTTAHGIFRERGV